MRSVEDGGCPGCGRAWQEGTAAKPGPEAIRCGGCGLAGRATVAAALRRALAEASDESAGQEIAVALAAVAGVVGVTEAREWLLARLPASSRAGAIVAALGALPDGIARAEATRIAVENFLEKRLSGRWDVVLAAQQTPAARVTLLQAVAGDDEAALWAAAQAMLGAWEEVPATAFPLLRDTLRAEEAPEAVRFCAAVLLARGEDRESWSEVRPWLMAALEAGEDADVTPEPTLAAIALASAGEPADRVRARGFLLARLSGAVEVVLERALPPLAAAPDRALIGALVAACRRRRVNSPSAERLAAAFGAFRGTVLEAEAFRALVSALEPVDAGIPPREVTLIAALGHLGHPEALPWLAERAAATEDPALQAAIATAQARLGAPVAIERCAALFLGETADAIASLAIDDSRVTLLAGVLAAVPGPSLPLAVTALLRSLETPSLAPHSARALAGIYSPPLVSDGSPESPAAAEIAPAPSPVRQGVVAAAPSPAPVRQAAAPVRQAAVPLDLDRTLEMSANLLPAVAEVQPYATAASPPVEWSSEGATRIPVSHGASQPEASPSEDETDLSWVRRGYGQGAAPPRGRKRLRLFRPMGLQRFGGVAGALATCAILGMGYMRWLSAQPEIPTQPRVLATIVVIKPGTTVHVKKGPEYPVIKTSRRGDQLQVVDKTARWWKVLFSNGMTGWIERRDTAVIIPESAEADSPLPPAPVDAARPAPAIHLARSR